MTKLSRRKVLAAGALGAAALAGPARASGGGPDADVIVIGAGLSGLHAALLLEELGARVMVLEGRKRLCGRVYTLMNVPGRPEAAGELIGANYARMLDRARSLGLKVVPATGSNLAREWAFHIRGQAIAQKDWEAHALNPLSGDDRRILPNNLLATLSNRNNPLADAAPDAWLSPELAHLDIPHANYLRARGVPEEAIRLMDVVIHTGRIDDTSALHELRRYNVNAINRRMAEGTALPLSQQIEGGNSLMPEAMAKALNGPVLTGKTVWGIAQDAGGVTVSCTDRTRYRARRAVSSMPLPVLRNIAMDPGPPEPIRSAIAQIDYGVSLQVHVGYRTKFWEQDGLARSMWTDTPIERFASVERGGRDPENGVVFINGQQAHKFRFMDDAEVYRWTLDQLAVLRPSTNGKLEPLTIQSCERDPHGAGDWIYFKPGQVTRFASHLRDPHGRLHFCGEHSATVERGMEAAFEAGERVALEVIEALA